MWICLPFDDSYRSFQGQIIFTTNNNCRPQKKKHYSDFDVKFMLVFKNCQNIQTILRKVNLGKIGPVFAKFLQSKSEVNTQ